MGGKALKNANTRRYSAGEYHALVDEVKDVFWTGGLFVIDIPAYAEKESFGDMDIILFRGQSYDVVDDFVQFINAKFEPTQIVKNGNVISFDYKELQIDFIDGAYNADFALNYFSFNDLGNFIGRTAHRMGFKFGHDGLWYVLRDPDNQAYVWEELLVTKSFGDALEFLGFDRIRHYGGFKTKQEIFEYATSSEYFDPAQFVLSNRSSEARRRDSTRQMYREMLEYLEARYPELNTMERMPRDYVYHLERALHEFKDFAASYWASHGALQRRKRFIANFNGDVIGKLFELDGVQLGQQMKHMRIYFEHHGLEKYVGNLPQSVFIDWCTMLQRHGEFDLIGE